MSALTKEALRELAAKADAAADAAAFQPFDVADVVEIGVQLRSWADDMEHAENGDVRCEGCDVWIAEGEAHMDSEGVELCGECWDALIAEPGT